MIRTIEQLERAVKVAEANRDQLKADLAKAEQAFMDNPEGEGLAMEAAKLELHIRASDKAVKRARDEYKAEQDRLNSPEALEAIKTLEAINKEGIKLTAELTQAAKDLFAQMVEWEGLHKQARKIARQYHKDPFDLGIAGSRLGSVKNAIGSWMQEVHSWERNLEIMQDKAPRAQPVKHDNTADRRRMLKERYSDKFTVGK